MKIFNFENIKVLRIEITSVCNAKCGGCARRNLSKFQHMDLSTWNNIINLDNLKHIEQLYFNGNYGDFTCHPLSLNFLEEIKNKNIDIIISTNGSVHNESYWTELASVLKKFRNHLVIFAIDGATEETHSLHRENTKFSKIVNNATEFISMGGNASWQFITFEENKHEIVSAYKFAKDLKFNEFYLQNSYSSITNSNGKKLHPLDSTQYLEYFLKYKFKKNNISQFPSGGISKCPWTKLSRIQINLDGTVWPCCWTAETSSNLLNVDLENVPNLNDYSLEEIINLNFYQKTITDIVNSESSYCNLQCPAKNIDLKVIYLKNKF
jgi:MoaA/NifB/PqqE/SkfB family radical SAM enzyme